MFLSSAVCLLILLITIFLPLGPKGSKGFSGIPGQPGLHGSKGQPGSPGIIGLQGEPGKREVAGGLFIVWSMCTILYQKSYLTFLATCASHIHNAPSSVPLCSLQMQASDCSLGENKENIQDVYHLPVTLHHCWEKGEQSAVCFSRVHCHVLDSSSG